MFLRRRSVRAHFHQVGLSFRPDIAGFNTEVEPMTDYKFRSEHIDPLIPYASQIGIRQGYGVDPVE